MVNESLDYVDDWRKWEDFVKRTNLPSHQVGAFLTGALIPGYYKLIPLAGFAGYLYAEEKALPETATPVADMKEFLSWMFLGFIAREIYNDIK